MMLVMINLKFHGGLGCKSNDDCPPEPEPEPDNCYCLSMKILKITDKFGNLSKLDSVNPSFFRIRIKSINSLQRM